MQYPFPFISKNITPAEPKLYLCKPDRTTIGRIKYADKISFSLKTGTQLSELNFTINKYIKLKDKQTRYYMFDLMKIKYLIRSENVWGTEYYIIDAPKLDDKNEQWQVHAYLLPYQIQDKKFYSFDTTDSDGNDSPVTLESALTTALSTTYSWKIGHIDDSLKSLYRSFSVDDTTALDFIQQIADKFNAVVSWDTVNRLVNMYDASTYIGSDKRFYINEKKYLKSLGEDINADTLVTRLHCFGSDTISLNSVNPTGQDYIEDYTYFIGDYARDSNGNVTAHSDWMSDSLCGALLDYKQLIADNTDKFKNYLSQLNTYQTNLLTLQTDLTSLQTDLSVINDVITVDTASGCYFYQDKIYNGTGWSYRAPLNDFQQYIIMCKSSNNVTANIDGTNHAINSSWQLVKKINGQDSVNFTISSGQNTSEISIVVILITSDEYSASGNESTLINKYNYYAKQDAITAKQTEITNCNNLINSIQTNITSLQTLLSPQNNFTQSQLEEWDHFINEDTFSDSNYIDANDLMDAAKKQLAKVQQPTSTFNISLTNFLQIVECQYDWEKLVLNDIVTIVYNNGVKIKANISQIDIDFDSGSISLQITNTKEQPRTIAQQWTDIYKKTIDSATSLNKNKPVWNSTKYTKSKLDSYINGKIYAGKQPIVSGIDQTEGIDEFGVFTKYNDNIAMRFYKGCLLGTSNGGSTWNVLASVNGVNAENIIGELMLDSQTKITSSTGSLELTHQTSMLDGSSMLITNGGIPASQIDSILVNNAILGADAKSQVDNLAIGTVNLVSKNQCFGTITTLTDSVGHSDFGLILDYNQPNGFIIPVKYANWVTVSFIACANIDNTTLLLSLNTKEQIDTKSDFAVNVGTQSQQYQWTVYYNDADLLTKDNLLKFWHVTYGAQILVQDIQLEDGTVKSAYHDATF